VTSNCLFGVDCPVYWIKYCAISLWHGMWVTLNLHPGIVIKGKGKGHPRTDHEDPEEE
jgi:hypothetical protein